MTVEEERFVHAGSPAERVRRAQAALRRLVASDRSLADELIAERRAEGLTEEPD